MKRQVQYQSECQEKISCKQSEIMITTTTTAAAAAEKNYNNTTAAPATHFNFFSQIGILIVIFSPIGILIAVDCNI